MTDAPQPHPAVMEALIRHGVEYRIVRHSELGVRIRHAGDVAAALGFDVSRIAKTLLVCGGGEQAMARVVCAMTTRVDLEVVGQFLGGGTARLATGDELRVTIPYPPSGVSPLGVDHVPVLLDEGVFYWPTVLIGGGVPAVEIEIRGKDLLEMTRSRGHVSGWAA